MADTPATTGTSRGSPTLAAAAAQASELHSTWPDDAPDPMRAARFMAFPRYVMRPVTWPSSLRVAP